MWTATYRYSYAFVRRDRLSGHLRSGLTEEKPAVFGVFLGELRRMLLDIREQACSQLEALLLAGNVATDRRQLGLVLAMEHCDKRLRDAVSHIERRSALVELFADVVGELVQLLSTSFCARKRLL